MAVRLQSDAARKVKKYMMREYFFLSNIHGTGEKACFPRTENKRGGRNNHKNFFLFFHPRTVRVMVSSAARRTWFRRKLTVSARCRDSQSLRR